VVAVTEPYVPPGVDVTTPSVARLYDYYLGGTNNFAVDRAMAERIRRQMPELSDAAWANRGFHQRAARWLAKEQGIRQFIDIGAGLPTQGNTHDVVQEVDAAARVVYVDNNPMVCAHAADLLAGVPGTAVIMADLREPGTVLNDATVAELIDFGRPLGLLMTWVLHFVSDEADPWGLVRRYTGALASGSYLVISHGTGDQKPPRTLKTAVGEYRRAGEQGFARTHAEVERFFEGLELESPYPGEPPRLAFAGEWGAEDPTAADSDGSRWSYCGVARCP
jgi:hypothetical protein